MPQLMPLMWINSIFVSLFILLVLVEIYYYEGSLNYDRFDAIGKDNLMFFKW